MSFENVDTLELKDRYNVLVQKYLDELPILIKKLEEIGRTKKELELLTVEFQNRGVVKEVEEELKALYDDKLDSIEEKQEKEAK